MTTRLAHARAMLGLTAAAFAIAPSLDARAACADQPIGVGAVMPSGMPALALSSIRPQLVAQALGARPTSPALGQIAQLPHLVAPQHPQMDINDRAYWSKIYMAIQIPVDSTVDAPTGVLPGASLQIKASSQVSVWVTDFTVDTDEPSDFVITQFKISRTDLLGGAGGVPASRFRQNSHRPQLNNEIISGGSFALIEVKNINKTQTLDFHGTMDGLDLSRPASQSM